MFARASLKSESYSKARWMHYLFWFGEATLCKLVHRIGSQLLFICSIGSAVLIGSYRPPSMDSWFGVINRQNNGEIMH